MLFTLARKLGFTAYIFLKFHLCISGLLCRVKIVMNRIYFSTLSALLLEDKIDKILRHLESRVSI